jgi:hypothetical protein
MDLVRLKGVDLRAVRRISSPPVIETHGLGLMLAGAKANGKEKKKQSRIFFGHRCDYFFYKVRGKPILTRKIY